MFYKLDCDFPMTDDATYFDIHDDIDIDGITSWARGTRFTVAPPIPIRVPITRIGDDDDAGLLPVPFNDQNLCIAIPEIIQALKNCGVENIQIYPAELIDTNTQQKYSYFAVNIIGLVRAADLGASRWINLDGDARSDTYFEHLLVDRKKAEGAAMFRLYEDSSSIIVNQVVKQALEKFPYLRFEQVG